MERIVSCASRGDINIYKQKKKLRKKIHQVYWYCIGFLLTCKYVTPLYCDKIIPVRTGLFMEKTNRVPCSKILLSSLAWILQWKLIVSVHLVRFRDLPVAHLSGLL